MKERVADRRDVALQKAELPPEVNLQKAEEHHVVANPKTTILIRMKKAADN